MREPVFAPISREGLPWFAESGSPMTKTTSWPSHDVEQRENRERVDAIELTKSERRDYSGPSSRAGVGALAPLRGSARRHSRRRQIATGQGGPLRCGSPAARSACAA